MLVPSVNLKPPFNITRCSHVCLEVRDLAASRRFYEQVMSLVVTTEDDGVLYLRGVEEACHHSLVLQAVDSAACCTRIGMRVLTHDLDAALDHFTAIGCTAEWVEVAYKGRTPDVSDPLGMPLQFCARMPVEPRQITAFGNHRVGCALRIDRCQVLVPDVGLALQTYADLGFRLSEYVGRDDRIPSGVFLQRKGNPHDIVFFDGDGPRLHHVAYMTSESHLLFRACDVAGELGFGAHVERGPGRHGLGHALFAYFRDPDGHRVEWFHSHYQMMDLEL